MKQDPVEIRVPAITEKTTLPPAPYRHPPILLPTHASSSSSPCFYRNSTRIYVRTYLHVFASCLHFSTVNGTSKRVTCTCPWLSPLHQFTSNGYELDSSPLNTSFRNCFPRYFDKDILFHNFRFKYIYIYISTLGFLMLFFISFYVISLNYESERS